MEQEVKKDQMDLTIQKIEEIYQSKNKDGKPTGKNFITHLIRSYFPLGKCKNVVDVPEKPMKCAITGQKLMASGEILIAMQNDKGFFKDILTKASLMYDIDPETKEATLPKVEHPFSKVANGRLLGLTGIDTDTYLCHEAYQALYNWYAGKILHGDNHINWVANDERKKSTIKVIRELLPDTEDQKKIDRAEQLLKRPKRASMSLGDVSALQELQAKLKMQENENK
jgi:hypothetical protein